jgi:high frequency lysogenization protein
MQNQVMALAAMCQAAQMVQQVAQGKTVNSLDLEMLLSSLVVTDPNSPEEIYRSQADLKVGYQLVVQQLDSGPKKSVELVKYVGGLIQLERALNSKPQQLNLLGTKIEDIKRRLSHFEITDESVIAGLADIYAEVVSPLGQRIQVFGDPDLLQQKSIQNKIRSLLLVGIRAAVLWRQMGGKRRQFILSKGKLVRIAKTMI